MVGQKKKKRPQLLLSQMKTPPISQQMQFLKQRSRLTDGCSRWTQTGWKHGNMTACSQLALKLV